MTLPPPPLSVVSDRDDEPTFADEEEELDWMLDCIAIETRIRTALRMQPALGSVPPRAQAFLGEGFEDEESGVVELGASSWGRDDGGGASSTDADMTRPWGRYLPPSSC